MNSLFLGLIAAGVLLVAGVVVYNWLQEKRVRRRVDAAFTKPPDVLLDSERVEPVMRDSHHAVADGSGRGPAASAAIETGPEVDDDDLASIINVPADAAMRDVAPQRPERPGIAPDTDIECVVRLEPPQAVAAGALAAVMDIDFGKPVRWLARRRHDATWHPIDPSTDAAWDEIAACMLLANRAGAASRADVDRFLRQVSQLAAGLSAAFAPPEAAREADRADELDRFCADLDVQVGLTILIAEHGQVAGTRLRGVSEAAGFRLNSAGHFDYLQEEGGATLYSLQNFRQEPFTVESLRVLSTPGVVLLLDVPRVSDPVRVFDHMRLAAKRIAHTLEGDLVDDNRRALDDPALAAIRAQILATAAALRSANIEPGGARAQRLFG